MAVLGQFTVYDDSKVFALEVPQDVKRSNSEQSPHGIDLILFLCCDFLSVSLVQPIIIRKVVYRDQTTEAMTQ